MVSEARLDEFIRIWEQAFGETIERGEAAAIANRLVEFYRAVSRPLPDDANN
jgi:hypothetical protein